MRSGWQTSTLGELLAVLRNGVNCKQDKSGKGDKISRIESISDASFDLDRVGYSELSERDKERYRLLPGDILFSHINSAVHVGKTAVFDVTQPVYHGVNLLLMRPKDAVTSAYLNHALRFLFQAGYWRGICKQSVNQASVNQQDISRVEVSYPKSLHEQTRIVGILDEAFEGIATAKANAEKNLQNARAVFESYIQSVLTKRGEGWEKRPLASVCGLFVDSAHRTPKYQDEGIPALRPRDVVNGRLNLVGALRVSEQECAIQSKRHRPAPGDIVYSRELSYGWAALLPESPRVCLSQGMCLFRPSAKVHSAFLLYVLNGSVGREQARRAAVGAAHPHINLSDIKAYGIPLPPLARQRQIVQQLDSLAKETHHLASLYERKLTALEALKKSLLHHAFAGQL